MCCLWTNRRKIEIWWWTGHAISNIKSFETACQVCDPFESSNQKRENSFSRIKCSRNKMLLSVQVCLVYISALLVAKSSLRRLCLRHTALCFSAAAGFSSKQTCKLITVQSKSVPWSWISIEAISPIHRNIETVLNLVDQLVFFFICSILSVVVIIAAVWCRSAHYACAFVCVCDCAREWLALCRFH